MRVDGHDHTLGVIPGEVQGSHAPCRTLPAFAASCPCPASGQTRRVGATRTINLPSAAYWQLRRAARERGESMSALLQRSILGPSSPTAKHAPLTPTHKLVLAALDEWHTVSSLRRFVAPVIARRLPRLLRELEQHALVLVRRGALTFYRRRVGAVVEPRAA